MKQNILLLSALLALAACSNNGFVAEPTTIEPTTTTDNEPMITATATVSLSDDGDTKLVLNPTADKLEIFWNNDNGPVETFSVLKGTGRVIPSLFTQQSPSSDNNGSAIFTGEIVQNTTAKYYAIYPAVSVTTSAERVPINLATQTGLLDAPHDESHLYMCAESTLSTNKELNFRFSHLVSIVRVSLNFLTPTAADGGTPTSTDSEATETITIAAAREIKLTEIEVTADGLRTSGTADIRDVKNITYTAENVDKLTFTALLSSSDDIYLYLIPGAKLSNIKIAVKDKDGYRYRGNMADIELSAGTVHVREADMEEYYLASELKAMSDANKLNDKDNLIVVGEFSNDTYSAIKSWAKSGTTRGILDLSDASFPNNAIGSYGFNACTFSEIILPEGLVSIGNSAFIACMKMKSITIPSTVNSIGELAFGACTSLNEIHLGATTPPKFVKDSKGDITAFNIPQACHTVYVPTQTIKDLYLENQDWNSFVTAGRIKIEIEK